MVNRITLIGRVGKDPEFKVTQGGTPMCRISLATSEKRKDKSGELVEVTEWHRINLWGKQAESARDYVFKGQLLYLEGKIHYDSYDKDGSKVWVTEINCHEMKFLSYKDRDGKAGPPANAGSKADPPASGFDDGDLPF